jgi:hypothetical protein
VTPAGKDDPTRVKVRLRSRASRSRERTEEIVEVEVPRTREGQINQLSSLVEERFPGADLRVFHDGAGSFTKDDLHVVAAYQDLDSIPIQDATVKKTAEDDGFRQLPLSA